MKSVPLKVPNLHVLGDLQSEKNVDYTRSQEKHQLVGRKKDENSITWQRRGETAYVINKNRNYLYS